MRNKVLSGLAVLGLLCAATQAHAGTSLYQVLKSGNSASSNAAKSARLSAGKNVASLLGLWKQNGYSGSNGGSNNGNGNAYGHSNGNNGNGDSSGPCYRGGSSIYSSCSTPSRGNFSPCGSPCYDIRIIIKIVPNYCRPKASACVCYGF